MRLRDCRSNPANMRRDVGRLGVLGVTSESFDVRGTSATMDWLGTSFVSELERVRTDLELMSPRAFADALGAVGFIRLLDSHSGSAALDSAVLHDLASVSSLPRFLAIAHVESDSVEYFHSLSEEAIRLPRRLGPHADTRSTLSVFRCMTCVPSVGFGARSALARRMPEKPSAPAVIARISWDRSPNRSWILCSEPTTRRSMSSIPNRRDSQRCSAPAFGDLPNVFPLPQDHADASYPTLIWRRRRNAGLDSTCPACYGASYVERTTVGSWSLGEAVSDIGIRERAGFRC